VSAEYEATAAHRLITRRLARTVQLFDTMGFDLDVGPAAVAWVWQLARSRSVGPLVAAGWIEQGLRKRLLQRLEQPGESSAVTFTPDSIEVPSVSPPQWHD
jgi:hypothetical protein